MTVVIAVMMIIPIVTTGVSAANPIVKTGTTKNQNGELVNYFYPEGYACYLIVKASNTTYSLIYSASYGWYYSGTNRIHSATRELGLVKSVTGSKEDCLIALFTTPPASYTITHGIDAYSSTFTIYASTKAGKEAMIRSNVFLTNSLYIDTVTYENQTNHSPVGYTNPFTWQTANNGILIPSKNHIYMIQIKHSYYNSIWWSTQPWIAKEGQNKYSTTGNVVSIRYQGNYVEQKTEERKIWFKESEGILTVNEFWYTYTAEGSELGTIEMTNRYTPYINSTIYNNEKTIDEAGNTYKEITTPAGWVPIYTMLGKYEKWTWMLIETVGPDGMKFKIQVPAAIYNINNNFSRFVIVKRFASEYGKYVYSLCYSDGEMYWDYDENRLTTSYLDGLEWPIFTYINNIFSTFDLSLSTSWTVLSQLFNRDLSGCIMTVDFDYLEDALYVLQHISDGDATYLEDFDMLAHYEQCKGGTIVQSGGIEIDYVAFVSNWNSGDGAGMYDNKGNLVRAAESLYLKDENGEIVRDSAGNPIQREVETEDIAEESRVDYKITPLTAFTDSWATMSQAFIYLDFLPDEIRATITAFIVAVLGIAISFVVLKFVDTVT